MKKQFSTLLCVCVSMIFLLSCQKDKSFLKETVEAISHKFQEKENLVNEIHVPFKGSYVTKAQFLQGPAVQRITGTGQATHLGKSMFVANATVNLTTPPPFAIAGTAVFTAANGDEFYTSFTGTSTPTRPGMSRGILNHTITGGNGRFEGVTGSFTGIALVNAANPTNSVTFEGSINY